MEGEVNQRKVDRVLANHSLSSTASQGRSNIPLSFLLLGLSRQARRSVPEWKTGEGTSREMNDGWRKRKETTHGESERETDERLDQDMRKDDEEPRAARERTRLLPKAWVLHSSSQGLVSQPYRRFPSSSLPFPLPSVTNGTGRERRERTVTWRDRRDEERSLWSVAIRLSGPSSVIPGLGSSSVSP